MIAAADAAAVVVSVGAAVVAAALRVAVVGDFRADAAAAGVASAVEGVTDA